MFYNIGIDTDTSQEALCTVAGQVGYQAVCAERRIQLILVSLALVVLLVRDRLSVRYRGGSGFVA